VTPERIARLREVLDRRQPDLSVITDFIHKPRNTSAIVRICDAVGIMQVHMVTGDAGYRAFRGTGMGSHNWVEVLRYGSLHEAVEQVRSESMQVLAAHPSVDTRDFREADYTRPTALLLGTERAGLGEDAIAGADHCIAIPMMGMVNSLNVSVAAGIVLAEAQRQRQGAGYYDRRRIDDPTFERLFFEWGHPRVRDFCRSRGLDYPALDGEGEIADPANWYAGIRELLADAPDDGRYGPEEIDE
jgi:tRNA (guanosine-2'-O-)-methyltransferase